MWWGKPDTKRNISCSITFSSTFHVRLQKFGLIFQQIGVMPGRRAGSGVGKYKTGQQKGQMKSKTKHSGYVIYL